MLCVFENASFDILFLHIFAEVHAALSALEFVERMSRSLEDYRCSLELARLPKGRRRKVFKIRFFIFRAAPYVINLSCSQPFEKKALSTAIVCLEDFAHLFLELKIGKVGL